MGVEDALGNAASLALDGQNHVIEAIDPRGKRTRYAYDGDQNLRELTNHEDKSFLYRYDNELRLEEVEDPLNHVISFDYDAEHHLTAITDDESNTTSMAYYANGQLYSLDDARLNRTVLTYDTHGSPDTSKTEAHPVIDFNYDPIGRMEGLTDQEGALTRFEFNNRGMVTKKTDPLGKDSGYTYDDAGRLKTVTDRNGKTTTLNYTDSGKVGSIALADGSSIAFSYNAHDKLTDITDALGATHFELNPLYQVSEVTNPYGMSVGYEYDASGNVTKIVYPDGKEVGYAYDDLGRLKTVTNWLAQTTTYHYDAGGRLLQTANFNGTRTRYAYDTADRLVSLVNEKSDGTVISSYSYTLDPNGNRTGIQQVEPLPAVLSSEMNAYGYDAAKHRLTSVNGETLTYDDEGQLQSKGSETYAFDLQHRLKSVSGSASAQYSYDALGNRLQAIRNGATTRYVYDLFGNLLAETDASGNITRYFIHGLGLLAMVDASGEAYSYHFDGTANTVALTDAVQRRVKAYAYSPYGEIVNQSGTLSQPFTYVGQFGVMREPNGLYYMRARYYDPEVGRFISEDPIGLSGGLNLYAYVAANPISGIDPYGLTDYTAEQTRAIVKEAVEATGSGVVDFFTKPFALFGGAGKYDYAANEPTSTFVVEGQTYSAAEFGNYIAGYATAYQYGLLGYMGTRTAGDVYGFGHGVEDIAEGRMPKRFWDSPESIKMINYGARNAIRDKALDLQTNPKP